MRSHLRTVPDIDPIGTNMAELARLWADLVDEGPSLDELYHVVMAPGDGGTVHAYFLDVSALLTWAEHLGGLAFDRAHVAGNVHTVTAQGPITRNGRTALVRLRATTENRSAS